MGRKRKKRGSKSYQFGGLLSGLFGGMGGGSGMGALSQIGNALQGFSNEPALQGLFSQSDKLFGGFKDQIGDTPLKGVDNVDELKPIFDLFSMFSGNLFGGGGFQDGGVVDQTQRKLPKTKVRERFGSLMKGIEEGIIEQENMANKQRIIQQFNQKHGDVQARVTEIIPGTGRQVRAFKKGGRVKKKGKSVGYQRGGKIGSPDEDVYVITHNPEAGVIRRNYERSIDRINKTLESGDLDYSDAFNYMIDLDSELSDGKKPTVKDRLAFEMFYPDDGEVPLQAFIAKYKDEITRNVRERRRDALDTMQAIDERSGVFIKEFNRAGKKALGKLYKNVNHIPIKNPEGFKKSVKTIPKGSNIMFMDHSGGILGPYFGLPTDDFAEVLAEREPKTCIGGTCYGERDLRGTFNEFLPNTQVILDKDAWTGFNLNNEGLESIIHDNPPQNNFQQGGKVGDYQKGSTVQNFVLGEISKLYGKHKGRRDARTDEALSQVFDWNVGKYDLLHLAQEVLKKAKPSYLPDGMYEDLKKAVKNKDFAALNAITDSGLSEDELGMNIDSSAVETAKEMLKEHGVSKVGNKAGFLGLGSGIRHPFFGGAYYNPITNSMNISGGHQFVEELAHAKQDETDNLVFRAIKDWAKNPYFSKKGHRKQYSTPGSLEYEAHEEIAPRLNREFNIRRDTKELDRINKRIKKWARGKGNPLSDEDIKEFERIKRKMEEGKYQQGGGIPISPRGQFDFPGQPVRVPTPDGSITMDGVNQPVFAMDSQGNSAILPANSGLHQFAPGLVLEIPIGGERRKSRSMRKKTKTKNKPLGSSTVNATVKNYNHRNARTMRRNKLGNVGLPNAKRRRR